MPCRDALPRGATSISAWPATSTDLPHASPPSTGGTGRDARNAGRRPRASQALIVAAKARAVLHGRTAASVEDVKALAKPILRHRVVTNFHAESEGMSAAAVVDRLVEGMR